MDPWSTVEACRPAARSCAGRSRGATCASACACCADEIVITNGAMEALNLSLQAVAKPGDAIAIESPTFYACLQAVESLGLRAVEIPTRPAGGRGLGALGRALDTQRVRAAGS